MRLVRIALEIGQIGASGCSIGHGDAPSRALGAARRGGVGRGHGRGSNVNITSEGIRICAAIARSTPSSHIAGAARRTARNLPDEARVWTLSDG